MDLIRRYARTLRVLHADAMRAHPPRAGAHRPTSVELVASAKAKATDAMGSKSRTLHPS
jgi:hypothetical protein